MFGLTKPDETISVKPFQIFQKELVLKVSYINPYTQKRALDSCVSSDNSMKQIYQGQTDEAGTMVWNNLEKGLYLITGEIAQY